MHKLGTCFIVIACAVARPAAAQWHLTAEVASSRYSGSSRGIAAAEEGRSFRPHRPTMVAFRLDRDWDKVGVGIALGYAAPGLALEGDEGAIVINDVMTVFDVAPEVSVRLFSFGSNGEVRTHAGPLVELWQLGSSSHPRAGVHLAISYEFPLAGRFGGSVRGAGALIASPFGQGNLPDGYEPRASWRRGVSLGLRYRL